MMGGLSVASIALVFVLMRFLRAKGYRLRAEALF
jgi:hypothetical protein